MIAIENDVSVEEMIAMKNDISVQEVANSYLLTKRMQTTLVFGLYLLLGS